MNEQNRVRDPGGVPGRLVPPGYRSMNHAMGYATLLAGSAVVCWVCWSLAPYHSSNLPSSQPIQIPAQSDSQRIDLPAPTVTPFRAYPQKRPALRLISQRQHPARVHPSQPEIAYRAPQEVNPPPTYYQAPQQAPQPAYSQPVQPVVDERARSIAEARGSSSAVNLDMGEEEYQGNYAMARDTGNGSSGSVRFASDGGNIGYEAASSRYELVEGTVIPCVLTTNIDSTIPGGIIQAQVIENVFDSRTHSAVVIPQGTTVIGTTEQTQTGQARLAVVWTKFYFPNGLKFNAGDNEGAGMNGENGMPVKVDTHAGRSFGSALLASVFQAGASLASRAATNVNLSTGNLVQQSQQLPPTMHAYVGQRFSIKLGRDEPFNRYESAE